jgi:uncharacterized protein YkwD
MEGELLALINQARSAHGARPLQFSNELVAAALRHSRDIARTGNMTHAGKPSKRQALLLLICLAPHAQ